MVLTNESKMRIKTIFHHWKNNNMTKIFNIEDNVLIWPNNEEVVFFLPILPENTCLTDQAYKLFVNNFNAINVEKINEDKANIQVHHSSGMQYNFEALPAFIENLEVNHDTVVIVPYCPQEGVPNIDVFGAKIPVLFNQAEQF